MSVTFETKCWEKDYKFVLNEEYLRNKIANCNYNFDRKVIIINNVNNREDVVKYAKTLQKKSIIDTYYFVDDYVDQVLEYFHLTKESFINQKGNGYYYSISELTSIYLCETDYIFHFASDVEMKTSYKSWISEALHLLESTDSYIAARPTFNGKFYYEDQKKEYELDKWFVGYWFTDHCYLAKMSVLKNPEVYHEDNDLTCRCYPPYGGRDFEYMIDAYIRNHNLYILTSKTVAYQHTNWSQERKRHTLKVYYYYVIDKIRNIVFALKK